MISPNLLRALATFLLIPIATLRAEPPATKLNVVFIMADDLGYGDLGCYGATKIATPHCDRLAREGRRFTDAHTPSAVCSPTRFGLMTGTYPWRGMRVPRHLLAGETLVIHDGEPTLPGLLKQAGYATGCIGKWHLGVQRGEEINWNIALSPGPNTVGFDYYFGVINSHNQVPYVLVENDHIVGLKPGERITIERHVKQTSGPRLRNENELETLQASKAVAFIEQHQNHPFFLYYPTAAVHQPLTPAKIRQGTSQAGVYGDYVQEFDWAVGEVLATLDRLKLAEKTIVVVTSDNGGVRKPSSDFGHSSVGVLRGEKTMAYEGGHRVPFLVRWPGRVQPGSACDETICHVDAMATLCAALNLELPKNAGMDSWNMLPAWLGEKSEKPLREATVCVSQHATDFSIRQGPWKLIIKGQPKSNELYNLADDLSESHDRAAQKPEMVAQLTALLERYRTDGRSRPN